MLGNILPKRLHAYDCIRHEITHPVFKFKRYIYDGKKKIVFKKKNPAKMYFVGACRNVATSGDSSGEETVCYIITLT